MSLFLPFHSRKQWRRQVNCSPSHRLVDPSFFSAALLGLSSRTARSFVRSFFSPAWLSLLRQISAQSLVLSAPSLPNNSLLLSPTPFDLHSSFHLQPSHHPSVFSSNTRTLAFPRPTHSFARTETAAQVVHTTLFQQQQRPYSPSRPRHLACIAVQPTSQSLHPGLGVASQFAPSENFSRRARSCILETLTVYIRSSIVSLSISIRNRPSVLN
jgi:hypothetical protein